MEQQLRPPQNWQDFETLCKKLWGEIWQCPEIKKNGPPGEAQDGVDLYGIPRGEGTKYYGIQCKKKDSIKNNRLSKREIDEIISEAQKFNPSLAKLYIATTANKSAEIEKYERSKNVTQLENGLFGVHIFFWEDIVALIDENEKTHAWYVKQEQFRSRYEVDFTFSGGEKEITLEPTFLRTTTNYEEKYPGLHKIAKLLGKEIPPELKAQLMEPEKPSFMLSSPGPLKALNELFSEDFANYARGWFSFSLRNNGSVAIDDYKLIVKFEGNYEEMRVGRKQSMNDVFMKKPCDYNCKSDPEHSRLIIQPLENQTPLLPSEVVEFDDVYLKLFAEESTINLHWQLLSRNYQDNGNLTIKSNPISKDRSKTRHVLDPKDVRTTVEIEDYTSENMEDGLH